MMAIWLRVLLGLVVALGPLTPAALAQAPRGGEATAPTLYKRLGGYDAIATLVDTAFPRVAAHAALRRFFEGHSNESKMRQRQLIVDILCQATGGPCVYIGRAMKPVHTGLGITGADWSIFIGIIGGALDELRVPPPEKQELLQVFARRFQPDVVERPQ
jgi:hemoglobin